MILHPKVIVIEENDDFDYAMEWFRLNTRGYRPEYIMCPKKKFKKLLDSKLWKLLMAPMFNAKGRSFEKSMLLYDRVIK